MNDNVLPIYKNTNDSFPTSDSNVKQIGETSHEYRLALMKHLLDFEGYITFPGMN